MSSPVLLAVDAGTSRIKAALVDISGKVLALQTCEVVSQHPFEGASEVSMLEVWQGFCRLTQELRSSNPGFWAVLSGICISGQGDGCWPVDEKGYPVRNAMLWNDTRSRELVLDNREALEQYCIENAITPLFPGAAPTLLQWMKWTEPENYARVHRVLHCKDWLNLQLTGQVATDDSDASTALTNVHTLEYNAGLLDLLGIPESGRFFPSVLASGSMIGGVTNEAAEQTGLLTGLPVVMGGIDVAVAAVGAGVIRQGDALTIIGTTLCNEVVLAPDQVDHHDTRGSSLRHVIPESFLRVMATSSGTSSIDWARQVFAPGISFKEIEASVAIVPPGSRGVMFHPYLYGERAPFRNPFACGGIYGLSAHHTAMDIMRAVYEGIGMMFLDCYQALPTVRQVVVTGGGASSDTLCQILADCLGKVIARTEIAELGLYGAYRLCCQGLNIPATDSVVVSSQARQFLPEPERQLFYQALYRQYRDLRSSMETYWQGRNQLYGSPGKAFSTEERL